MKAADKKAPSEMAVNLMMTSTVPTTLTQSKIVFPVSDRQRKGGASTRGGLTVRGKRHEISVGRSVQHTSRERLNDQRDD
jgi:hypothetical protein